MTGSASMVLLDLLELASRRVEEGGILEKGSAHGARSVRGPGAPGAAGGTVKGSNMPNVYCRGIP